LARQSSDRKPNPIKEKPMKKLSLVAIALFSTSAVATDARTAAHQNNAGMSDDTDYRSYFSRTDNSKKDSVWFDLDNAGTGVLSGAYRADGRSMTLAQGVNATNMGYYSADGDTGYAVGLELVNMETFTVGGGYGTSSGDNDMAFYGSLAKSADIMGLSAGVRSRDLSQSDVTVWGAQVDHNELGNTLSGGYGMGMRFKTDRSKAAVTVGPALSVAMPEGGDMAIDLHIADVNIAGEFALNDWFGLRGSVVSGLALVDPTGELDLATTGVAPMFGASLDFEGADIDLVIDPNSVMNGPYFLTGAASAPAVHMSARFDI
jgi:hypothetical protein